MRGAYYNEIDPYAAQWLRNLIAAGLIPAGDVDERSIADVSPDDLKGYVQCHFFAGIGGWAYAGRLAGWPDDEPIWTGSCPCQPFSAAGKGRGFADERHLWPDFHWLIEQFRPPIVFGEQVASKDGLGWVDLVQADLEGTGYAVGAVDFCAAGVGAPHIRQRLWWVAERLEHAARHGRHEWRAEPGRRGSAGGRGDDRMDHHHQGLEGQRRGYQAEAGQRQGEIRSTATAGELVWMGHSSDAAGQRDAGTVPGAQTGEHGARVSVDGCQPVGSEHASPSMGGLADANSRERQQQSSIGRSAGLFGAPHGAARIVDGFGDHSTGDGGLADADGRNARPEREQSCGQHGQQPEDGQPVRLEHASSIGRERGQEAAPGHDDDRATPERAQGQHGLGQSSAYRLSGDGAGPTNGFWRDADWLFCRDGKWRPVEPGTFPLAHGAPARVGRLRAYGNAIVSQVAAEILAAYREAKLFE